ncbi:hypothetical protein Glove_564g44 [Diversispora epigaea]|uniref:Uncharacterized protein n=1 Tax=Diversispora epigaea TaxID=1348612 RepID=A0A397GDN4_9GLOM|nr:hypothetical protein Glove_564g44 [Diversispora epigaea]
MLTRRLNSTSSIPSSSIPSTPSTFTSTPSTFTSTPSTFTSTPSTFTSTPSNSFFWGKVQQTVIANKEAFIVFGSLISGVSVVCSIVIGNNWKLKNDIVELREKQIALKERQDNLRKEIKAMLEGFQKVHDVYNTNWGAILNKGQITIPTGEKKT